MTACRNAHRHPLVFPKAAILIVARFSALSAWLLTLKVNRPGLRNWRLIFFSRPRTVCRESAAVGLDEVCCFKMVVVVHPLPQRRPGEA